MTRYSYRLDRLLNILVCPKCKGELIFDVAGGSCSGCLVHYPVRNGKIYFVSPPTHAEDDLDRIKGHLKRLFGKLYYLIGVNIIAPTYPFNFSKEIRSRIEPRKKIVIDI